MPLANLQPRITPANRVPVSAAATSVRPTHTARGSVHPVVQAKLRGGISAATRSDTLIRRKPAEDFGRTDYAFDTGRATAAQLQDPVIVERFNAMSDEQLEQYRAKSRDFAVIEFIGDILQASEDARREVVRQVVKNYAASVRAGTAEPGGACFAVARERVEEATRQVAGESLTAGLDPAQVSTFDRLWGVLITPKSTWLDLPEEYRGKGSAGAIAFAGKGQLVDQSLASSGLARSFRPGERPVQEVKMGNVPESYGHSFIFIRYVRGRTGNIVGMRIADQGFQSESTLKKSAYGFWVGANILIPAPRPFVSPRPFLGPF